MVRCAGRAGARRRPRRQIRGTLVAGSRCQGRPAAGTGVLMAAHASDQRPGPGDPGHPALPVDPGDPVDPGRPAFPVDPGDPVLPGDPGRPSWACWGEPHVAARLPGLHDVPDQAVRDSYRRLKFMQGFDVQGGTGIDCHGLAVEVAVERELGLSGRAEIGAYGLDRFNARCRESAQRHAAAFSALSTALGCLQVGQPRPSMDPGYIESVWWSLCRTFEAGLLERRYRITPYCPRCQTPLSSHDLNHPGAQPAGDGTGVIVRFRLATLPDGANPRLRGADLLAWTARPWTLAANAAIAVHPHQSYALAGRAGREDRVILAEARLAPMLGEDWHVAARIGGADLAGATYHPALSLVGAGGPRPVIPGYFVQARAGTGLEPLAPAFDADDLTAATAHGLPVLDPLGPDGRFAADLPLVGGMFFTDASRILTTALSDAGALLPPLRRAAGDPRCWRCGTPLLPRAMSAWYLRGSAGTPDGGADWMVSRTRFWGTPLPLWECPAGHLTCAESLARLSELAATDLTAMDPHRPQIDSVIISCPRCCGPARRVPDVLDTRFEAGWLPFADSVPSARAVSSPDNRPRGGLLIASAGPGTGWPAAVQDVAALVCGRPAGLRVLRLPPVPDAAGRAMSSGLGNLVEPLTLIERFGADVIRWFSVTIGQAGPDQPVPEASEPWSEAALAEITRTVFAPYRRAASLLGSASPGGRPPGTPRGAGQAGRPPGTPGTPGAPGQARGTAPPASERPLADRQLLTGLQAVVEDCTASFERLTPASAGARIARFLGELAGHYLPACEVRLAADGNAGCRDVDSAAALATLRECLDVLTRLMAPIAPFVTEEVWALLRAGDAEPGRPESVHRASWPFQSDAAT